MTVDARDRESAKTALVRVTEFALEKLAMTAAAGRPLTPPPRPTERRFVPATVAERREARMPIAQDEHLGASRSSTRSSTGSAPCAPERGRLHTLSTDLSRAWG